MWWLKALAIWGLISLAVSALIGRFVGGRRRENDDDDSADSLKN
jgi:hypothetical protein